MAEPLLSTGGGNLPSKNWINDGYNLGNNTFGLATEIRGNELNQMVNAEIYGKKAVRPRRGGINLGDPVGGNQIDGLFQFKSDTVNDILAISGGLLKKYNNSTEAWDTVTGGTFTADLRTRGVKLQNALYFGNGIDDFARYKAGIVEKFNAVASPTGLTVTPQGTTGTAQYAYQVNTVTGKGDSIPCAVVAITNGNLTLDTTNKNRLVFNRRTEPEVIGYQIFGRATSGMGITLMKYLAQPASGATITWDDDGTVTPQIWLPPEGDSTDGPKLGVWEQLRGSLVGAKDPNDKDKFYYSGTGEKYESFSPAHNGGWIQVRQGDNDAGIRGLVPFESKIIIGKENSIHQFYFSPTTGDAIIQEIITYVGVGGTGSMVVMENDIAFVDSERKLRILGYEPNYQASLRTTSLSEGRAQSLFDDIDPYYMDSMEAVYFNGRYLLAATSRGSTKNNIVLAYDRRYLAFLGRWEGSDCHVANWLIWDGANRQKKLFAGSSDTGQVFEFGVEGRLPNHDGTVVETLIRNRNEDLGNSGQLKVWLWNDMRLYRISGTLNIKTIIDGDTVISTKSFSSVTHTGWGVVKWGTMMWGLVTGVGATTSNQDKPYRKEINEMGNTLQFEITKTGVNDDFILISMRGKALLLPEEVFDSERTL